MAIGYSRYLNVIYIIGDVLVLNLAFWGVSLITTPHAPRITDDLLIHFFYLNLLWLIILFIFRVTDFDRSKRAEEIIAGLTKNIFVYALVIVSLNYFLSGYIGSINYFYLKFLLFVLFLYVWRISMLGIFRFVRSRGMNYRRVVIVGHGHLANEIYYFFNKHPELGYRLLGVFHDLPEPESLPVSGRISDVEQFSLANSIDEIYCSSASASHEQIRQLVRFCDRNLIRFKFIPDFRGLLNRKVNIDFYEYIPVVSLRNEPLESFSNRFIKRLFDIVFSLSVIVLVISWLLPLMAIVIKLTSSGPVFFRQKRSGRKNIDFYCLKFRTMKVNSEADERQATRNDPRITPVGRILRRTNLDELPQFFNVILNQMSVVGPRPHMLRHTEEYSNMFDQFMVRHLIKPGITGWAQVNGYRGETSNPERMRKRVEHDVWYIENWSLFLDLKIIYLTVITMIFGDRNAV